MSKQMGLAVGMTSLGIGFLFGDILLMMAGAIVILMERTSSDS